MTLLAASRYSLLLVLPLLMAGCGQASSARQVLGMEKKAPDAFSVSPHAPLEVPASLNVASLPKPQPGLTRPQEKPISYQAQTAVLPMPVPTAQTASAAEQALLANAGATQVPDDIRLQVNAEAADDADVQSGPMDFLVFWKKNPEPGVVVNAKAEAERLAKAKAAGQPLTAGATPVKEDSGRLGVPKEIK